MWTLPFPCNGTARKSAFELTQAALPICSRLEIASTICVTRPEQRCSFPQGRHQLNLELPERWKAIDFLEDPHARPQDLSGVAQAPPYSLPGAAPDVSVLLKEMKACLEPGGGKQSEEGAQSAR